MRVVRGLPVLALSVAIAACEATATPTPTGSFDTTPGPSAVVTQPPPTTGPTDAPATSGPTPGGPTSAPPSGAPSGSARWAASPPTPILVGSIVRVTVEELSLRDAPFTSATQTATIARGTTLYVEEVPPVDSDGYVWYRASVLSADGGVPALPTPVPGLASDAPFGWFAASTGDTKHVSRLAPRCPTIVNLKNVAAMTGHERLTCFGGNWVEVEGTFRCYATCLAHALGEFEPAWLAFPANLDFVFAGATDDFGLQLKFPPGIAKPALGTKVRIRGHLRDAASETCTMAGNYGWPPEQQESHAYPDAVARLLCRQEFVVESYVEVS